MEIRTDLTDFPKVEKTQEGYYKGSAIVTRTGVFSYKDKDGTLRKELRHPNEIFKKDSLSTLKGIPITIDHPKELLNSTNVKSYAVGYTGDTIEIDGQNVIVSLTITNQDAIDVIRQGKKELSLGYTLNLESEKGSYNQDSYEYQQKDVSYNHLAIVDRGRAGAQARLNFDQLCYNKVENEGKNMKFEKISFDGLDFEIDPNQKENFEKKESELKSLRLDKKDYQKKIDILQARCDQLELDLKKAKEFDFDAKVKNEAQKRVEILNKAKKVSNLDHLENLSNFEIKKTVLKNQYENLDLSNKSQDYIDARFDALVDHIDNNEKVLSKNAEKILQNNDSIPKKIQSGLEIIKNQWKS